MSDCLRVCAKRGIGLGATDFRQLIKSCASCPCLYPKQLVSHATCTQEQLRKVRGLIRRNYLAGSKVRRLVFWYTTPSCSAHREIEPKPGVTIRSMDGGEIHIAPGCFIGQCTKMEAEGGKMIFGPNYFIRPNCVLISKEHISSSNTVVIAEHFTIRGREHGMEIGSVPFCDQEMIAKAISFGSNVRIGAKSSIRPGGGRK